VEVGADCAGVFGRDRLRVVVLVPCFAVLVLESEPVDPRL
jgi:hypothetical protein